MDPPDEHDLLMTGMIAAARSRGLTWAQIGSVFNKGDRNPKLAKKQAKAIRRRALRAAATKEGAGE